MMQFGYLGSLLFVIGCLLLVDWRWRLAFFYDWRRTIKTVVTAVIFFLVWDILGIALQIFFPGQSAYTLSIMIAPRLPLEEVFFLFLLTYLTLLLWRGYVQLRRA